MNIHPFSHRENPRVQNKQQYHQAKPTQALSSDSLHFQGQRASAGSSQKQTKYKKGLSWLKCLLGKSGNSAQRQNQRGPTVKSIIKMSQALPEQMRIPTNALKEMNSTALQRIERFYMGGSNFYYYYTKESYHKPEGH